LKRQVFETYHPAVLFLYLFAAVVLSMVSMHPAFLGISLAAGCLYAMVLKGARRFLRACGFFALLALVVALLNPLFGGAGATLLFYIGTRPVTLEALVYGLCSAVMLLSVLVWFQCWQELMTSERFYCLFGRLVPVLAMMVSMVLRFIPLVARRASQISEAQEALFGQAGALCKEQGKGADPPEDAVSEENCGAGEKTQKVSAGRLRQRTLCAAENPSAERRGIGEKTRKVSAGRLRKKTLCAAENPSAERRGIGEKTRKVSAGRLRQKTLCVRMATVLVGLTMENAIETADSMRARGYSGVPRHGRRGPARTSWQSRPLGAGDWALLVGFGCLAVFSAAMMLLPAFQARFYPRLSIPALPVWAAAPYALLLLFPLLLEGRDRLLWRCSRL